MEISRRAVIGATALVAVPVPALARRVAGTSDPVVALVDRWFATRAKYESDLRRVKALEQQIPEDVRDGPRVRTAIYTCWVRGDQYGVPQPVYKYSERTINTECDLLLPTVASPERKRAIEEGRQRFLADFRQQEALQEDWYRRVGMPYSASPEDNNAYWEVWHSDLSTIEDQILATPATSTRGLLAKLRFTAADLRLDHQDDHGDLCPDNMDRPEKRIMGIAADAERLFGGAS